MIFPIGDINVERGYKPYVTYLFIAINILVFGYQLSLSDQGLNQFIVTYGNIPLEASQGVDLYTLITCVFMHGGFMHIIGNMLFLWVFADNIEAIVGPVKFILFYMVGALAASVTHIVIDPQSTIPTVGASGAISASLGAYIVMFPKSKIKVLVVLFFRSFQVSAIYFLGLWIIQQIISGVGALQVTTSAKEGGVAYWAHIGGFVFGVLCGFLFKKKVAYTHLPTT
jgi:membrane associated rhomboid family serine protease